MGKYQNKHSLKNKLYRVIWNCVWFFSFKLLPGPFLYRWRNFWLRIFGAEIGINCKFRATVKVWMPCNLTLGDSVAVGNHVNIYNVDKISIGSNVTISQDSMLCTASHDITKLLKPLCNAPIVIKDNTWVASDAFVGMGVTIGEGAVVGARACVFKDVEPWTVVGGNPAKFIKKRELKP